VECKEGGIGPKKNNRKTRTENKNRYNMVETIPVVQNMTNFINTYP